MKCAKCSKNAVFKSPNYCKEHFIKYVESTIKKTVKKYSMIEKGDKVVVAVSGGKDSITCLHNLSMHYEVEALAIDEGIKGYRDHTLRDLRKFCSERSIKLHEYSLKEEFGFTLDKYLKKSKEKPCTACGAFRRWMINTKARELGADKLATGHNLDDEAQSVLMNFFRNQLEVSARLGPVTGITKDKRFIPRIKPLYVLSEREILAYSMLKGFEVQYVECPYAVEAYRAKVRDLLNDYEQKHPGSKKNIIKSFLKMLPELKEMYRTDEKPAFCKGCGEPSKQEYCKVCQLKQKA